MSLDCADAMVAPLAYATACIGKWNLGTGRDPEHNPMGQGLDELRHYRRMGFLDMTLSSMIRLKVPL